MPKALSNEERIYRNCRDKVHGRWGRNPIGEIGTTFYRALLCEEVLVLLVQQHEALAGDKYKLILDHCWSRIMEDSGY